ncbi:MAG TPA: TonB-dependent receptor [Terracidiphilus sp.]|nr:TonB-dependent receptor [Terracidiphilus sp.]
MTEFPRSVILRAPQFLSVVLVLLVSALIAPLSAHAQFQASLRGTVTDPSGAVIPGAKVTLLDKDTNQTRTSVSDASGIYTFNALPPDHFKVTAERQGFKTQEIANVVLIPEQPNLLNIQLVLGGVQQTVTVNGSAAPLLDTGTATVSATISSQQIQHLPSFNRDVFQLAQLAPGVFGDASQGSGGGSYELPGNQGPGGSGSQQAGIFQTENGPQIQDRGGQYETNSISIDGISTVSAVWGGTSVITPSEDSVQNVKVVSNSYDAEVGRFSGGQIEVTTKSGTNELHGSAFFKASRPGLNAYQRWNGLGSEVPGTPSSRGLNRDESRFNNYGGSLGGPIWKNKIFAFFNYETSPYSASATGQGWYETSQFDSTAAPSGSIALNYLSYKGEGVASTGIIQTTCAQIGLTEGSNCATTPQGLDVGSPLVGAALGTQDPSYGGSSSIPGVGGGLDGVPDIAYFNTVDPTSTSQQQYNGRIDANVTQNDHLAFAIYWVPVTTTNYNGPVRSANFWHHSQVNDAFSLIWNHTFSPTLLNQARANAAGWRWNEVASNPQEPFGLPQDNIDNMGNLNGNFQYFGAPGPSNFDQWTYDYNDVLTKVLGRHSLKTGGDLTRLYYLNNPVYQARPSFNFRNVWDFANDAPYSESGQFNSSTGVPFANRQDDRVNILGFFVQDDFKARPNLTINAGLRWSYFGSFYSKENNLDVLQFGPASSSLSGLNVRVGGNLYTPQKWNFGPQLGFAWLPKQSLNKLVIRGGYGINYNQNEIAILANGNGNPPNAVQVSFCCSTPTSNAPGILYETATNINSIFGYAPNSATITTFGSNNLPTTGSIFVTGFQSNPKTIVNYHYSLDAEYELPFDLVATLGYQGSETRHLLVQSNFNAIAAAQGIALNPAVNNLDYYANTGTANYNAMIATFKHNFTHHFNAEAQYTWAKAMDENSGPYEEDPYPYNSHAAYGRSDYNVANAFKLFGLWQPVFFGGHGWAERIAGGWSLSGIFNIHSGFPFNPIYSTNTSGGLYYNGSGYSSLRPASYTGGAGMSTSNSTFMQAMNPNYKGNGTTYFSPPVFANGPTFPLTAAPPAPGIQRNSLNGPGYNDLDASLAKAFGLPNMRVLGENAKFEVRIDTYNLFNKINLDATKIDNTLGSVNPDGTISSVNSDFGVARSALGSRTVQLQARFSF